MPHLTQSQHTRLHPERLSAGNAHEMRNFGKRPLSFFTLLRRPSLSLKHRHQHPHMAVNTRVREATTAEQPTPGAEQKAKPAAAVAAGQQWAGAGGDMHQQELFEDHHEEVVAPSRDEHAQDSNLARTAHSSTRDQPSCCHEQYRHQGQ